VPVRDVLRYPHPALKRTARALGDDEPAVAERVAADLVDTMRAHQGCVGLAAPQIDAAVRAIVVDVSDHPKGAGGNGLLVLVNPAIVRATGSEVAREGCLSIPALTANVRRAVEISVEARSPGGEPLRIESAGFEARCIQHELDHLDGLLFLDRVDSLKTDVFRRKNYSEGAGGAGSRSPEERAG
jgi:peptide deformylase